jgi:hypothetical protein
MKLNTRRTLTITFHALFWLLPIIFVEMQDADFVLGVFRKADFQVFYPLYYGVALNMVIFYGSVYFLMPRLQKRFSMLMAVVGALLLYAVITTVEVGIDTLVVENHEVSNPAKFHHIMLANFLLNFVMMPIVIGYFFMQSWMTTDKNRRMLREENLRMEVQFLKSQINPHFLFNTLNNLYVSARKNNDMPTADGISHLSGMMRYMIYDTNVEHIMLAKEMEYLKNYIELQKRRFSANDPIDICFEVNGDVAQVAVAPMLLIPFVENAFKHGISLKNPSYIHMELNVLPGHFTFTVKNSIFKKTNQAQEGGIGLKNVKRRLELLYSGRYELKTEAGKDTFTTVLNINTLQS